MVPPSAMPAPIPAVSSTPSDLESILEINRAAYDTLAGTYTGMTEARQESAKKWLTPRLPLRAAADHPTALDIGCADGAHSRVLSALGYKVTGVDVSAGMISAARDRMDDPTVPNKPRLLHGEFMAGLYVDEYGADTALDGVWFDLVLATAFVHLFPPETDEDAVHKVLCHVAPGGSALISTTAAMSNRQGFEAKTGTDGQVALRWRNHYTLEYFTWLVCEAARDVYGAKVPVRPWVVADPDSTGKLWIDIAVTRPA